MDNSAELTAGAAHDGARGPVMMLTAGGLRTVLVTIHEPLSRVPSLLTVENVVNAGLVTAQALHRDAGPEDMVGVVSFFLSEDARFVTGQTIHVNGGLVHP